MIVVDVSAAQALVEAHATVLDTRGRVAFLRGHVPGAQRVDWRIGAVGGVTSGKLGAPLTVAAAFAALGVDDHRPVLVVGDWDRGWGEEGRIAWDLAWLGHPDIHVLEGGYAAWTGAVEHLAGSPVAGVFTPHVKPALRADSAAVLAADVVIDVREPDEYAGATPYGESRGGHIPGARSIPWRDLMARDPRLSKTDTIVVYCTGGVRSGMAWLKLQSLGYTNVANYDGSWWEWARERTD